MGFGDYFRETSLYPPTHDVVLSCSAKETNRSNFSPINTMTNKPTETHGKRWKVQK